MSLRWTEEELEAYKKRVSSEDASQSMKAAVDYIAKIAEEKHKPGIREDAQTGKGINPTEDEEQMALFEWARLNAGRWPELRWLYHVPNGGSRGPAEAGRFAAMGVKRGVPDVALDEPRGGFHGLRIEMKRRKGGKVSDEQQEWIDHYNSIGFRAVVCYGWDEAREAIETYLSGGVDRGQPQKSAGGIEINGPEVDG